MNKQTETLVTIATFSLSHEAHFAKAQLDAFGIPSFLADEHIISIQSLYTNAIGGVRLQVPEEFAAQAWELLNGPAEIEPIPELEIDPEPEPEPAVCPYCDGVILTVLGAAVGLWAFTRVTSLHGQLCSWSPPFSSYEVTTIIAGGIAVVLLIGGLVNLTGKRKSG